MLGRAARSCAAAPGGGSRPQTRHIITCNSTEARRYRLCCYGNRTSPCNQHVQRIVALCGVRRWREAGGAGVRRSCRAPPRRQPRGVERLVGRQLAAKRSEAGERGGAQRACATRALSRLRSSMIASIATVPNSSPPPNTCASGRARLSCRERGARAGRSGPCLDNPSVGAALPACAALPAALVFPPAARRAALVRRRRRLGVHAAPTARCPPPAPTQWKPRPPAARRAGYSLACGARCSRRSLLPSARYRRPPRASRGVSRTPSLPHLAWPPRGRRSPLLRAARCWLALSAG